MTAGTPARIVTTGTTAPIVTPRSTPRDVDAQAAPVSDEASRAAAIDRGENREASPGVADPISPGRDIGFDQKLGEVIPLELEFRDEAGRSVRLGEYFGTKPVVLSLAYYGCPMLCGMSLQGIASSLKAISFDPGREFEVLTVSFDPREGPALARGKKAAAIEFYGRPQAAGGWHFLTGDAEPIRRLTSAVGFRYVWDEEQQQFAHATGIVVLTPEGKIARYFFGIDYAPRDLRLGLVEASSGTIGGLTESILLLCYRYDPRTGRYSAMAMTFIRAGSIVTVLGLSAFITVMLRRERSRARSSAAAAGAPPEET